ncbi:rab-GTPase-TBC domain-containing protein [Mycena vulgaris]|nr:rab-GTPase-TBC domain-containing protein [Mycena vulgaris]
MEASWPRASGQSLKQVYTKLFASRTPLSRIRDAALADRLFTLDTLEVPGRSLAWKLFLLLPDEPLQPLPDVEATPPLHSLRTSRKQYTRLLTEHMRAPDGSYEEGFVVPGSSISPERQASASNLETNNPLSLHNENPWKEWFTSVSLRETILQDVERTFPEIAFFREPEVQLQLTNILFIYSTVTNPAVGYRQGMHELLAPLFYAVDYDSTEDAAEVESDAPMHEFCSRTWVAADAWALFEAVMRGASRWYEWQEPPAASRVNPSPFTTHVNIPVGPVDIKPYITPVVEDCNRIQSNLLRTTDPLLWKHMQAAGIEPQIYGIRWLRLLYTREFDMRSAMKLWDGLFACDPTFGLAPWICVAMLIRIRNELIPSDYSGQLTSLLRYPSHPTPDGPHHTSILLRQALALQMSPNQATGNALVLENRNFLNISIEVPEPPPPPQRRGARSGRDKTPVASGSTSSGPRTSVDSRQQPTPQMGLEVFARGLLERGESLGINKTLMSAVPELRRNLSELAASFVRSPTAPSFPMVDERPPEERPPWEPKSRLEIEREVALLHSTNRRLAESLGWAVDVLLQDETASKDLQRLQSSKREALEAISYVRDILTSNLTEIENERLFGEEETARRKKAFQDKSKKPSPGSIVDVPQPAAPTPVPVIDSRPKVGSPAAYPPSAIAGSFGPPAPSNSALSPTSPSTLAPWHYTRSNFSAGTLPSASLPRIPPPTSATIRRPPEASRDAPRPSPPRRPPSKTEHDPLGVL